jgi:uncharacterized protein (DUF302 family)
MATDLGNGVMDIASRHTVDETIALIGAALAAKGIAVFCQIDHSGEAQRAGLTMRPTKLLLFGSPKAGTPVMVAAPSIAIDLPLKALIWEDGKGQVRVSYNNPGYLQRRHGVADDLIANLAATGPLLQAAVA